MHVIDTMSRIPLPGGGRVVDKLKSTTESAIALVDDDTWFRFHRRRVVKPYDVVEAIERFFQELDFDQADIGLFTAKILQFFTTSDARRLGEYEHRSWWDFLEGDLYSPRFQRQLRAVPRTMVAMDPKRGSARTVGSISMQLILDYADSGVNNDRTMGGPTSEMWFDPWIAYLTARGVHPDVLRFCRAELVADDYFHAVLEATKSIADKLRARTGLTDDGAVLVDRALSGDLPMLAINDLSSESERGEQRGFANLVKGVFGMFRNPTAHAPRIHWAMNKADAEDLLSLASLIHRRLDSSRMPPRV